MLNFNNNYSKTVATILFYSFKLAIYHTISFISAFSMSNLPFGSNLMFGFQEIIFNIISLILCCWYFRKFLTEFFITYNTLPSWLYWLCLVPFFDYLTWPIILLTLNKKNTISQKTELFQQENKNHGIAILITIINCITTIITFEFYDYFSNYLPSEKDSNIPYMLVIFAVSSSIFLIYLLVKSFIGWKVVLTIQVILFIIIAPISFFSQHGQDFMMLKAKILLSAFFIYSILPIFHLDEYWYIGEEENDNV